MKLYNERYFSDYSDEQVIFIKSEIERQADNYILNVNIDDYIEYLYNEYKLNTPILKFNETFVDTVEKDIPKNRFPRHDFFFFDDEYGTIKKQVIIYHIPFEGNINLLRYIPNPRIISTYEVNVDTIQKCILIEVVNFYNDPEKIKNQYNEEVRNLTSNYDRLLANFKSFNDSLKFVIKQLIENRKQEIINKNHLLTSLGVPIKEKNDVTKTFAIPKPKLKEKIVVKPIVHDKSFKPEPCLDDNNYHKILKIINDVGKNFERLPSTYKGKSEEDIRDHILLILDPNFELGSAGGETFNKIGKTDISLRYDSSVVFIAECKYWKGEKVFMKTIDQLLGYLTWRNSKVSIINFVQNQEFSEVLTKVKTSIVQHPNFLKERGETDETWFNYKFHLNGDRNRELDLAIISFHLPK